METTLSFKLPEMVSFSENGFLRKIGRFSRSEKFSLNSPESLTIISYFLSPSKTTPASRPPIAMLITFKTSFTLRLCLESSCFIRVSNMV